MKTIDISSKSASERKATARCLVEVSKDTVKLIKQGKIPKGDPLSVSQTIGMLSAKWVPQSLPFCHPIPITSIDVSAKAVSDTSVEIISTIKTIAKTGVEIEALFSVSIAALNFYDMVKNVDKLARITDIELLEKEGGKSGKIKRRYLKNGKVIYVAKSKNRGTKQLQDSIMLVKDKGVSEDVHAGTARQVSVFALESLSFVPSDILKKLDITEITENITIVGIPYNELYRGRKLIIGEAMIEISDIGKKRHVNRGKSYAVSRWGIFAKVLKSGYVKRGDNVFLLQ